MKPDRDNWPADTTAFDEITDLDVKTPLSRREVRELAGLLSTLAVPSETEATCRRVRARLFAEPTLPMRTAPTGRLSMTFRAAAAIALLITGLAVFRVLPLGQHPAIITRVVDTETTLIFPDEAVIDARLACLEADMTAMADESFWKSSDASLDWSKQ